MTTISFDDPVEAQAIPELMIARRAFVVTQELFAAPVLSEAAPAAGVGWHDTAVCAETGAIAVVPIEGALSDLVGEIVVIKTEVPTKVREVYVYVIGRAPIADDISLSRRAFLELAPLSTEVLEASVEVIA